MASDHESRILGMALLLGDMDFAALVEAWNGVGTEADLEFILRSLPRETYLRLEQQVEDLEGFLESRRPGALPAPEEEATARFSDATLPKGEEREGSGRSLSFFDPRRELGQRILSMLTLPRLNQYADLTFVGEGGMGRIFKAFDTTLRRTVALKFLRRVDRSQMTGLMEEARNLARVNHPNICKVFEAKEWQGQIFVAMQYVEGRNLDKVAPELTEPEKVEVMEKVAEAMHAAHRQGLIHRDLKPANIMVETTAEGLHHPFVLDFGLARDLGRPGETLDGSILGTTHYMAPEQARGDLALIGRGTDVYALGVTLYELFAGAPPFHQAGNLECLRLIQEEAIPPLRLVVPGLHADLDTIVMKCLEKDLALRYASARALAEDLRRYREGEPILARPATFVYRAGKFARKHRSLVLLGAAALIVAGGLGAFGLNARLTASSRAQWAGHFGQEAERIEALIRYTRLQPRHGIQVEMNQVLTRIRAMEGELATAGGLAQGPGNFALGRAYLALGEPDRARACLDKAWAAGYQVRDVSYARGRALGSLYARGLLKARTLRDPGLREARIQELEETLRNPGLQLLRQGRGSTLEPERFQEGLQALFEHHYGEALKAAREASLAAPWFYESRALEAQVYLDRAGQASDPGTAALELGKAGTALEEASVTAPSDPGLWDLQSRRWWEEMIQLRRQGLGTEDAYRSLALACAAWKQIVPEAPGPDARLAWGDLERARTTAGKAKDGFIASAIALAEGVLRSDPDSGEALGALAEGLRLRAYAAMNGGEDPRPGLDRALVLLRRALKGETAPFELFESFASTLWTKVEFERMKGRDPSVTVLEAAAAIHDLSRRYPKVADFAGFLGGIQVELADFQACHGIDPGPAAAQALQDLDRAARMAPGRFEFQFGRGNAHLATAQYRILKGLAAGEALDASEAAYLAAHALNRSVTAPLSGLGEVGLLRCQELEARGRNPLPALAQAEGYMAESQKVSSGWRAALFFSQAALIRARRAAEPAQAAAFLATAQQEAARAQRLGGDNAVCLLVVAQVHLAWARVAHQDTQAHLAAAKRTLRRILDQDPAFEPALRLN